MVSCLPVVLQKICGSYLLPGQLVICDGILPRSSFTIHDVLYYIVDEIREMVPLFAELEPYERVGRILNFLQGYQIDLMQVRFREDKAVFGWFTKLCHPVSVSVSKTKTKRIKNISSRIRFLSLLSLDKVHARALKMFLGEFDHENVLRAWFFAAICRPCYLEELDQNVKTNTQTLSACLLGLLKEQYDENEKEGNPKQKDQQPEQEKEEKEKQKEEEEEEKEKKGLSQVEIEIVDYLKFLDPRFLRLFCNKNKISKKVMALQLLSYPYFSEVLLVPHLNELGFPIYTKDIFIHGFPQLFVERQTKIMQSKSRLQLVFSFVLERGIQLMYCKRFETLWELCVDALLVAKAQSASVFEMIQSTRTFASGIFPIGLEIEKERKISQLFDFDLISFLAYAGDPLYVFKFFPTCTVSEQVLILEHLLLYANQERQRLCLQEDFSFDIPDLVMDSFFTSWQLNLNLNFESKEKERDEDKKRDKEKKILQATKTYLLAHQRTEMEKKTKREKEYFISLKYLQMEGEAKTRNWVPFLEGPTCIFVTAVLYNRLSSSFQLLCRKEMERCFGIPIHFPLHLANLMVSLCMFKVHAPWYLSTINEPDIFGKLWSYCKQQRQKGREGKGKAQVRIEMLQVFCETAIFPSVLQYYFETNYPKALSLNQQENKEDMDQVKADLVQLLRIAKDPQKLLRKLEDANSCFCPHVCYHSLFHTLLLSFSFGQKERDQEKRGLTQ